MDGQKERRREGRSKEAGGSHEQVAERRQSKDITREIGRVHAVEAIANAGTIGEMFLHSGMSSREVKFAILYKRAGSEDKEQQLWVLKKMLTGKEYDQAKRLTPLEQFEVARHALEQIRVRRYG